MIGASVGLLTSFVKEDGLLQGALVGAVTGALVSVELADSLLRIWTCDDCPVDARLKLTVRYVHFPLDAACHRACAGSPWTTE